MTEADATDLAPPPASTPPRPLAEFLERYDALVRSAVFEGPRYRIHFDQLGEGPALYICSGICSTRRSFAPLAVELAERFRVVIYDHPGIVDGDGANLATYRFEDYPLDLIALADHLGDRFIDVMGFSYGSTVTVRSMAEFPGRVRRAMLIGAFAHRPLSGAESLAVAIFRHFPGRLSNLPFSSAIARYNHGPELDARDPALMGYLIQECHRTPIATAGVQAMMVNRTDLRPIAPNVMQPVFIFHGEQDRLAPIRHAAELSRLLPNHQVMIVPGCGHMPQLSHPELLARVVEHFFSDPPGACSSHAAEPCADRSTCSLPCENKPGQCE